MKDRIESTRAKFAAILPDLTTAEHESLVRAYRLALSAEDMYAKLVSDAACRVKARKRKATK